MKPVRTLILMASESRLLLVENAGVGKGLHEILSRDIADFGELAHDYADAPGREQAAPGTARHAFDRHESERDESREAFARKVIEVTLAEWQKGGYDRLIVAAPPRMLGVLRADLPAPLKQALLGELDKDLIKLPLAELPSHLDTLLAL